jgi:uncharacterized MAPEG superfamily protein
MTGADQLPDDAAAVNAGNMFPLKGRPDRRSAAAASNGWPPSTQRSQSGTYRARLAEEVPMTPALRLYAITTALLFFKMAINSGIQGFHRIGKKAFVNPEDARLFGGTPPRAAELPQVQRAAAVWRNDLENIPIFLFLALVFTLADISPDGAPWYFGTFVVARFAHMVFYMNAMQPWRFLAYTTGQLACVGMAVQILLKAW